MYLKRPNDLFLIQQPRDHARVIRRQLANVVFADVSRRFAVLLADGVDEAKPRCNLALAGAAVCEKKKLVGNVALVDEPKQRASIRRVGTAGDDDLFRFGEAEI